MVLTSFPSHSDQPRACFQGSARRLQQLGEIIADLYPSDILVSSDEDETDLDDDQLALLEDIADYQRALLTTWQPSWA